MDKSLRTHLRILWVVLAVLATLCLVSVGLTYFKKPATVIQNYVGQNGKDGQTIQGPEGKPGANGYTPIKGVDYTDGATGAQGPQGIQGETGPQGAQGDQGPAGEPGQDGRSPEFRCNPKNHNYEWRYVGDEAWQTLQKNSQVCQSAL